MNKPTRLVDDFWRLVEDIHIGMLVTQAEDGELRSRPMETALVEPPRLWFVSPKREPKTVEIMKESKVNISYAKPSDMAFLSISGKAQIVENLDEVTRVINSAQVQGDDWPLDKMKPEEVSLIKVDAHYAEFWDHESGIMSVLEDFAEDIGLLREDAVEDMQGEHEKIQFVR